MKATVEAVEKNSAPGGNDVDALVAAIKPAVEKAEADKATDVLDAAVRNNVANIVADLRTVLGLIASSLMYGESSAVLGKPSVERARGRARQMQDVVARCHLPRALEDLEERRAYGLRHLEVDGQLKDASAGGIALIGRTGYTLLRVDAHGSGDILRMDGRATVQDSWLHDPGGTGSAQHNDVIQSTNATYIRILHNRLENPHTQTSCILLKADLGPIRDVVVDGNLMNGGGYSFYWYDAGYKITDGAVTNNRFMRQSGGGFWPKGGYYGTRALQASTAPAWSNNTWNDNGEQISM